MSQNRPSQPRKAIRVSSRIAEGLAAVYLIIAALVMLAVPFQARGWLRLPLAGGFYQPGMRLADVFLRDSLDGWDFRAQGVEPHARLVELAGEPVNSSQDLAAALAKLQPGELVNARFEQTGGQHVVEVPARALTDADQLLYFYLPYIIGLIYLLSAAWIFWTRRYQDSARAFCVFATSVAIAAGGWFDALTGHFWAMLWYAAIPIAGAAFFNLALVFPHPEAWLRNYPAARFGLYGLGVGLGLAAAALRGSAAGSALSLAAFAYCGVTSLTALGWIVLRRLKTASLVETDQIRLIFISAVLSFLPVAIWLAGSPFWPNVVHFSPLLIVPLALFPLAGGYALQRYGLLRSDFFLRRASLYALLGVLVAAGYALMATGASLVVKAWLPGRSLWVDGLIVFLTAMLLLPAYQALKRRVDAVFVRGENAYPDRLQTFSGELTHLVDIPGVIKVLRRSIEETLMPASYHIFVYDPVIEQYAAAPDASGKPSSDLRFGKKSGLVLTLEKMRFPIEIAVERTLPLEIMKEQARLRLLGAEVYAPLLGNQRLAGWVALGRRASGKPYDRADLGYLDSLCDQAALAIERAQVVANLETRVRELNVLARVSQMINITLSLDDILELVFAQSSQVVPAENFAIMLRDEASQTLFWQFLVQDNERLTAEEGKALKETNRLERVVLETGQAILTDDYARECKRHGIFCEESTLANWMGLPLNAGAGSIGVLSVSTQDPTVSFHREQMDLLQAIADQAAGAIVKARLLEETEKRARQLTTLNELARQLGSTLELDPLLNHILDSAVEILNCEAGSLLLVEEPGGDLVFTATAGPVASELLGKRIPAGTGVVGKAVSEAQALIINDLSQSPEWFSKPDQDTGFRTRNLLVVPLQVKDSVTGVLEVINRNDGLPFLQEDLDLLAAFAGQAGIAIDNARLYTRTDQALEMKVDELSTLQTIDRELNASLDTRRALQITLEWALRQSGAAAGLIGSVAENRLHVAAAQGYETPPEAQVIDLSNPAGWQQAANQGAILRLEGRDARRLSYLPGVQAQVLVPLRREATTIGLLVLESRAPDFGNEAELNQFLARMSDHASIAVSNAQLYEEVQRANLAKSEFVSFVSHELKNPMTSIKGYTELILAGAVGPVNDAQKNFLGTIRSNVERMTTLVSDLADVSRIEAGRLRLDFVEARLADVVEEVMRSMKRQVEEKNLVVSLDLPEDLVTVWADKTRLNQIITNFVSNAVKYTEAGGQVWLGAESCENRWDAEGATQVVHFWTRDSGIGISEEDQPKIFQKFFRSEDPKTREAPGTGLGLNITRSLVEYMGGKIWFESEFRKGTTFHFTIPVAGQE